MGDAMSENQRDMEALALRQHFGKRNRCDKCGQGVLLHFVDGAGVVLCPKEEPCHSHTEWAAGFSMGPRKTRHKVTIWTTHDASPCVIPANWSPSQTEGSDGE